jgi:F-type H+-transporting ATPase subunit epsilon
MAKQKTIDVVVITPERQVLEQTADSVVLPAHDGELGVLPERAPLMCELGVGQLRYQAAGQMQRVFIDGGFAQVHDDRVIVLTGRALRPDEITADVIAAEKDAAASVPADDFEARWRARQRVTALERLHHPTR